MSMNPYLPLQMKVEKNIIETQDKDIRTFVLSYLNPEDEKKFQYMPGQFAELMVFGKGEAPFGMASSPTEPGQLKFSVMKVGTLTNALHQVQEGDIIGVRGPLGNYYPVEQLKGNNVVIIGGGFAFTTLRALATYMMDDANRGDYGDLTLVYGARSPGLLLYKDELAEWQKRSDIDVHLTVDACGDEDWSGCVGFVPTVTKDVAPSSENAYAILCGPPVMIKYTLPVLEELGFPPERIITSLEMRMKCGIGMCGRCNIGSKYVCKDGPVFSFEQLKQLPSEY